VKEEVARLLADRLPTGDKKAKGPLAAAIDHLAKSLDPGLFVDDMRLAPKTGDKVFGEEKEVVRNLTKIKKPEEWVSEAVSALVCADGELVKTALADAIAQQGDRKKISEAQDGLDKAAKEIGKGKFDKAIDRYKDAWKKAQEALDGKK
jgi:hypothetical protein